jgi:reactive intermediate/imine deaminase
MANKAIIQTDQAPGAIGTYSQAIKINNTVYLSGQIPLDPEKMTLVSENIDDQINQVFLNLRAVCEAAGGDLSNIVKLNIFLTDLDHFSIVNEIMSQYFTEPYPARAAIGVKSLPKGSKVEMDGVVVI